MVVKGVFVKRALVNGKWMTRSQISVWLDNTVQNVILSGFDSPENLYAIINKASGGSQTYNIQILERLSGLYEERFSTESAKYATDPSNSPLLPLIIRQKSIILNACKIVTDIQNKADAESSMYDDSFLDDDDDDDLGIEMIDLNTDEKCNRIKAMLESKVAN